MPTTMTRAPNRSGVGKPAPEGASGTIWYMGAKTRLLPELDAAIGPLLEKARARRRGTPVLVDAFAGTGAVGTHFSDRARVIAADAQAYAATLSRATLLPAPGAVRALDHLLELARPIEAALAGRVAAQIEAERGFHAAAAPDLAAYRAFIEGDRAAMSAPEAEAAGLAKACGARAVATAHWRNIYFGVAQAVAIDALRGAIERVAKPLRQAFLGALLFACSRATSGTSHFAQPRALTKESELSAMLGRRRIDVKALFTARVYWLAGQWRRGSAGKNDVIEATWTDLVQLLGRRRVDVVYADPPYTRDQYSRFYHVLETLAGSDSPPLARDARGRVLAGRYPEIERRFQSRFASEAHVEAEFRRVTEDSASLGAALVWSYSRTNGLLLERWDRKLEPFRELLLDSYKSVEIHERPLRHSGQGDKSHAAIELIAVCEGPRR